MTRSAGGRWASWRASASRQNWLGITRHGISWKPIGGCSPGREARERLTRGYARSILHPRNSDGRRSPLPHSASLPLREKPVTTAYRIDPLLDPRWAELAERHPRASVFHTPGWLEALRRTYGYEPVAYTTTPLGTELTNGIVLCRVYSRITGRRLVSLPFSDHCEPLIDHPEDLHGLVRCLQRDCAKDGWKYVEIRPRTACAVPPAGLEPAQAFFLHPGRLNLELEELFQRFHNLGGMHLLFWNAIQEGKRNEAREFDMGRSDSDNPGLITFKDRWGAARSQLTYWRYPTRPAPTALAGWGLQLARYIFAHIPDTFQIAAGRMLYRHLG